MCWPSSEAPRNTLFSDSIVSQRCTCCRGTLSGVSDVQLAGPGCLSSPSRALVSFTAASPRQPSHRRRTILLRMVLILTMQRRCTAIGGKTHPLSMHPGMPTSLAWRRAWVRMLFKPLQSTFLPQQTVHLPFTQLVGHNLMITSRFALGSILFNLKADSPRRFNC